MRSIPVKAYLYVFFIFMISLFSSCVKEGETIKLSDKNELLSFKIEQRFNSSLKGDIVGEINAQKIFLEIPKDIDASRLIASFEQNGESVYVDSKKQISGKTENDFTHKMRYEVIAENEQGRLYEVVVEWTKEEEENLIEEETVIPHVYIEIEGGQEVVEKKTELNAQIRIDGQGKYDDYQGETIIRGRGNSSWGMPKKPYRLKLNSKASLMGLPAFKNWVLLNEYLDGTMLYNSIPFKAGQLLEIPYTNTMIPVELTINGEYKGMYVFTEHKEVGEGRIDIGDNGVLLELDSYYDEDWKFKSDNFNLPVMVQYPKSKNMSQSQFDVIREDFNTLDRLVYNSSFPNNNYLDYFDDLSFVNYMIVYELTLNMELNHPKSTYVNKVGDGKYRMGIIWDFDWSYGYDGGGSHYLPSTAYKSLFWNDGKPGGEFFQRLMSDPHMRSLFKERWTWFKSEKMEELKRHIEKYAASVSLALEKDHQVWGKRNSSGDSETDLVRVMNWLDARIQYLDQKVADW